MKKIIKYFSIILFSAFFIFLLASEPTHAMYDSEKNTVKVSVSKNEVKISVTYQRGMGSGSSAKYFWCTTYDSTAESGGCVNHFESNDGINYVENSDPKVTNFISQADAATADKNLTTVTFKVPKVKDPLLNDLASKEGQTLILVVNTSFCAVRNESRNACDYYDSVKFTSLEVKINDLLNNSNVGEFGTDVEDIEDEEVKSLMEKISGIVYDTVLPIIWIVLGLFLVIKGALLGVQIVKAADEPQVRQEKVGALKWLVIGVAIAYLATGAVRILTGFFSGAFGGGK